MSRPIASRIGYPTGQVCNFLHSQLVDAVNNHQFILKDSLGLIRIMDSMNLSTAEDYFLTSADVVALYPSISIEDGLAALQWFMKVHTNIPENLQILYLHLARFVLENNYVECKGLDDCTIFLQKIGTAMGISFSVTYANIFMLWLESPVVHDFEQYLLLYKRFLDDLFVLWMGPSIELCNFRARLSTANPSIKYEWQNLPTIEDAVDPAKFDRDKHRRVNFLDLDIKIIFTMIPSCSVMLEFSVYRKPGNAFSYYLMDHIIRGISFAAG